VSRVDRLLLYLVVGLLGMTFSWVSFWMAWHGRSRAFGVTLRPAIYVLKVLNPLFTTRQGLGWVVFFVANALFWAAVFCAATWVVIRLRSTSRRERRAA